MRAFAYEAKRAFTNHNCIHTNKGFKSEMKKSSRQGTRLTSPLVIIIIQCTQTVALYCTCSKDPYSD